MGAKPKPKSSTSADTKDRVTVGRIGSGIKLPASIARLGPPDPEELARAKEMARASLERMTPEENDEIVRGALWDPDSPLLEEIEARRAGWLPPGKRLAAVKLDQEVVDFFVKDGPGWHERINAALRKAAGLK